MSGVSAGGVEFGLQASSISFALTFSKCSGRRSSEISKLRSVGRNVDSAESLLGGNFDEPENVKAGLVLEVEAQAEAMDVEADVLQDPSSLQFGCQRLSIAIRLRMPARRSIRQAQ